GRTLHHDLAEARRPGRYPDRRAEVQDRQGLHRPRTREGEPQAMIPAGLIPVLLALAQSSAPSSRQAPPPPFDVEQTTKDGSQVADWLSELQIRASTSDPSQIEKPASLQYVNPGGDSNSSYSIDLGISLPIEQSPYWTVSPAVEFHKQTLVNK